MFEKWLNRVGWFIVLVLVVALLWPLIEFNLALLVLWMAGGV